MKLTINGKIKEIDSNIEDLTLTKLLDILNINSNTVAIELNANVIYKDNWDKTKVLPESKLEIVRMVGGG